MKKTEITLEDEPIILGVTSKQKANAEKCRQICETYLSLSKLPHVIGDKARRLQIACMIRKTRLLYLS
jgi:hypothetical protein